MSEQDKGSLLLPLGIGAGLLLLLTSMKKKDAATPVTTTSPDDAAALLPEITAAQSTVPQIDPAPAPSYTSAVAKTAGNEDDEESGEDPETEDPQEKAGQSSEGEDDESGLDDEDSGNDEPSYASKGGGSYTPYGPTSTINTNRQLAPLPAPAYTTTQAVSNQALIANRKSVLANKNIRFQSDQAKKLALQKARNNKSIRFQSDQAKKFAARSGTASNNPLFIGKGKPRMGVRLPVTQRPGATAVTAAALPAVNITSQPAATPAQTSIFPLKFGTTNPYVKEVQRKLGVSATGYFGTMTRAAIQKRFQVSEISEALYKQIITGKAPVPVMRKPIAKPVHKIKKPLPKKFKAVKRK